MNSGDILHSSLLQSEWRVKFPTVHVESELIHSLLLSGDGRRRRSNLKLFFGYPAF
jgi:hypothetical protein